MHGEVVDRLYDIAKRLNRIINDDLSELERMLSRREEYEDQFHDEYDTIDGIRSELSEIIIEIQLLLTKLKQ